MSAEVSTDLADQDSPRCEPLVDRGAVPVAVDLHQDGQLRCALLARRARSPLVRAAVDRVVPVVPPAPRATRAGPPSTSVLKFEEERHRVAGGGGVVIDVLGPDRPELVARR